MNVAYLGVQPALAASTLFTVAVLAFTLIGLLLLSVKLSPRSEAGCAIVVRMPIHRRPAPRNRGAANYGVCFSCSIAGSPHFPSAATNPRAGITSRTRCSGRIIISPAPDAGRPCAFGAKVRPADAQKSLPLIRG